LAGYLTEPIKLEEYCYREIDLCDVVVSIVGGRYGSGSVQEPYSISQLELKTAIERGKAVFIFVDRSVLAEFGTYLKNKNLPNITYSFVDNPAVYKFLEEIEKLPKNNPISAFETTEDIIIFLREQWSGLFQRYLQAESRVKEVSLVESLGTTAQTLNQLVSYLTEERRNSDQAIRSILITNHPAFQLIRNLLRVSYRVFFTTREELSMWLKARSYNAVEEQHWDGPDFEEWINTPKDGNIQNLLKISTQVFDARGNLKVYTAQDWEDKLIQLETRPNQPEISDDDIPF
jgi:hypothetical protein